MDSIATSAKEQSLGLAEVNTAANQMDQVTQQNAAMVEETSAASATLANESAMLRELIFQFRLGHDRAAPTARRDAFRQNHDVQPVPMMARQLKSASIGNAAVKDTWEEF